MSFILDALRKSETERQRQSGPGLVDAGYRPPAQRRGPWLPVLVIVLAANLVAMGWFWLRREAPAPTPAAVPAAPAAPTTPAAEAAAAPAPAETEYAATADLPAVEAAPASPATPTAVTGDATPPAEAPVAPATAPARHVTDALPTAAELMASGAIPTQDLHLDIHVYSKAPAERFVFINMRKYTEGAQLPMGVKVEEITQDGVVLSQDGQRFELTRD